MLLIIGTIRSPSDRFGEAVKAMADMILASRSETGCIDYGYARDVIDDGLIHVKELWRDRNSLNAHFASAHIAAWRSSWRELGIGERNLVLYEVGDPEPV